MAGMLTASGDQVVLSVGDLRLTVVTMGGGLRELTHGDWHVLDGYDANEVPYGAYGQPLIPWPNRLAGGTYEFRGQKHQVPLTEPEKHNALHGFARWMTWDVAERGADHARLALDMYPRAGYPFALRVEVDYRVAAYSVTVATIATNAGRSPLPYANGFHPYIAAGTPRIDNCALEIPAAEWMPTDENQIPTGRGPVDGTMYDFRAPRKVGSTRLDTAFTGLIRDADGKARVRLTAPDSSRRVAVWMDGAYGYVMAFTGDTLGIPTGAEDRSASSR